MAKKGSFNSKRKTKSINLLIARHTQERGQAMNREGKKKKGRKKELWVAVFGEFGEKTIEL